MNQQKILLICAVGFVLQMYMLIWQYVQFNTVVNVDYESSKYHSLPAVTICLPQLLSMKKVVEYFQRDNSSSEQSEKVTKAYELYQTALVNFSSIETNNMTRNEFMISIYNDNFESLIPNLTIMQLYEMSILMSNETWFTAYGNKLNPDGSANYIKHRAHAPIESIMLGHTNNTTLRKCFTYFSHLDEWYRNIDLDMYYMILKIVHDETHFPLSFYYDRYLTIMKAIHSGNTIPQDNNQFEHIYLNKTYRYEINRLKIQLLKSPYKTNCHDYGQTGKCILKLKPLSLSPFPSPFPSLPPDFRGFRGKNCPFFPKFP